VWKTPAETLGAVVIAMGLRVTQAVASIPAFDVILMHSSSSGVVHFASGHD
jgi:hypothetical protein